MCSACADRDQEHWFAARPMTDNVLKLIRFAMSEGFEQQLRPHLSGQVLLEFHDALESLIVSHLPSIPVNSLRAACLS